MSHSQPVVLVDIFSSVVSSMTVQGISLINFQAGRYLQILKSLADLDMSVSLKDTKFPLIALSMPIKETRDLVGFYGTAHIKRIVIAVLSQSTDDVPTRYQTGGTFKETLYPCYYEFLKRLAQSPSIIGNDPDTFKHTKMDNPGMQPTGQGLADYVDTIEILDLEIKLTQIKTC